MKILVAAILYFIVALFLSLTEGKKEDQFNFETTSDWKKRVFGPKDWSQVTCDDLGTCPGWPTHWQALTPYIPDNITNTCYHCVNRIRDECKFQKQSPIDLWRNTTATRYCHDRHRMYFVKGNCSFEDLRFEILPHTLRARQPSEPCDLEPNIDFSWGFPHPWMLTHTDVVLPSLHRQDGRQYDAEIVLSHVYSEDVSGIRLGNVAILLEKGTEDDHYDFLELYIQRWRQEHEKILLKCNEQRRERMSDQQKDDARHLFHQVPIQELNFTYFSREFHPYDWYLRAGTHYYFRYEGSTTEPPCIEGVHWRVLKDPAKVAPSQISALQSLLVNRVDPDTCKPYTAARIGPDGSPHVNRPIQRRRPYHLLVYCECIDWESFTKSDRAYCKLPTNERGVVVRTEAPSQSPQPSVAPTSKVDVCECPTEKSSYLCNLFLLIRPTETPICPI